jgi:aspartate racemase
MATLTQKLVPGIVGISTYVDFVYHREMQQAAVAAAGTRGPINQLRTVTATLDFGQLIANLQAGRRDAAEDQVAAACTALAAAGCDFIVVTSGTTSTLTSRARAKISIPFLDLAEACWKRAEPIASVGLLCTRYAAAGGMFQRAAANRGMPLLLPAPGTAERVDQAIFGELVLGHPSAQCIRVLATAIEELAAQGAASVILGNTDMSLVTEELQKAAAVPLIDAARAHARDAAHVALAGRG